MALKSNLRNFIKLIYPDFFVKSNTNTINKFRILSGIFRVYPDFIIIGSQKCGTTSLYDYICQHSNVYPAITKQIHYFDFNYNMNNRWYRAFFPSIFKKFFIKNILKKPFLTGEASPDYIDHPYAPIRISKDLPQTKLIAIFRDPVERAYSNYQHNVRDKNENFSFEDALKNEKNRIEKEKTELQNNEFYYSEIFRQFRYVERGIYVDQISEWLKFFSKDQILIISTEELQNIPSKVLEHVFSFLDLSYQHIDTSKKLNVGNYSKMKNETRNYLENFFDSYNKRLYKLINMDFEW